MSDLRPTLALIRRLIEPGDVPALIRRLIEPGDVPAGFRAGVHLVLRHLARTHAKLAYNEALTWALALDETIADARRPSRGAECRPGADDRVLNYALARIDDWRPSPGIDPGLHAGVRVALRTLASVDPVLAVREADFWGDTYGEPVP